MALGPRLLSTIEKRSLAPSREVTSHQFEIMTISPRNEYKAQNCVHIFITSFFAQCSCILKQFFSLNVNVHLQSFAIMRFDLTLCEMVTVPFGGLHFGRMLNHITGDD